MSRQYRTVRYRDELLADRSVERSYDDGRREWRRRAGAVVQWRDDRGRDGVDEALGSRIVKRVIRPNGVLYGRECGYGRTAWSDGLLTVNQTSTGGRVGAIIAGVGAAGLLPAIVDPPSALSPAEEEELRRQVSSGSGGDGGGGGDSGGSDDDWTDSGDGDDDFG